MTYAFMFPGQGSQRVGMGADLYEKFDEAVRCFEGACEILQRDIKSLCFEGPEESLKATENTQPALFTVEAAICDVLRARGITPSWTAGHSLGEYAALYAAGVFSFEDGLRLVARRGRLMGNAGADTPGAMAAVIGLDPSKVDRILKEMTSGVVVCANFNSSVQTVISGEEGTVKEACDKLTSAGAKRAVLLPVSGAFHSPLMQKAADEFEEALEKATFSHPRCPVVANVSASLENDAGRLKQLLVRQLVSPVRWVESLGLLAREAPDTCIETGPGAVLQGLARKTEKGLRVVPCGTAENIFSLSQT